MKYFIASDIHGSAFWCRKMIEAFERENADRLVLLGDILYHGPRNDLPKDYAPKDVIALLNPLKEKILCVRGNCEAEVDQMVLEFPVLAEYALIDDGTVQLFLTHGHVYNESNVPPFAKGKGTVLLCGHTHNPACREHDGYIYMNPGSVAIPKEGSYHGYIVYDNGGFIWKDLDGDTKNYYTIGSDK